MDEEARFVGLVKCFRRCSLFLLVLQLSFVSVVGEKQWETGSAEPSDPAQQANSEFTLVSSETDPDRQGWASLSEIRYGSGKSHARIVIQLTQEVKFEKHVLFKPERIYFDLRQTTLHSDLHGKAYEIDSLVIRRVRLARNRPGVVRLVLDLKELKKNTVLVLQDPFRIVVEIQEETEKPSMESAFFAYLAHPDSSTRHMGMFTNHSARHGFGVVLPVSNGRAHPPFINYLSLIQEAASRHRVDHYLVQAIVIVESHYDPSAVSSSGCLGLMQLHPETAQRFGVDDPFDPAENIEGGVKYLNFLMEQFEDDLELVVAAYNAGEGAVSRYNGVPPYRETIDYVHKVKSLYHSLHSASFPEQTTLPYRMLPKGRLWLSN